MKQFWRIIPVAFWAGAVCVHAADSDSVSGSARPDPPPGRDILSNGTFEAQVPYEKVPATWTLPGGTLPAGWEPEYSYGNAEAEVIPAGAAAPGHIVRLKRGALRQGLAEPADTVERVMEIAFEARGEGASCLVRVNGRDCFTTGQLTGDIRWYRGQFVIRPGERVTRFAIWNHTHADLFVGQVSATLAAAVTDTAPPHAHTVTVPDDASTATIWLTPGSRGLALTMGNGDGVQHALKVHPFSLQISGREEQDGVTILARVLPEAGIAVSGLGADLRRFVRPNVTLLKAAIRETVIAEWDRLPSALDYRFPLTLRRNGARFECLVDGLYAGSLPVASGPWTIAFTFTRDGAVGDTAFETAPIDQRFLPLRLDAFQAPAARDIADRPAAEFARVAGIPFLRREGASVDLGPTSRHRAVYDRYTFRGAFDALGESFLAAVPPDQYIRAWVLCALEPAVEKDPSLTVRLTRFVSGSRYSGRARESLADTTVCVPREGDPPVPGLTRVGSIALGDAEVPLWLAEVPLKSGQIQDIIFDDKGPKLQNEPLRDHLDVEILGPLTPLAHPFTDARHLPLARPASGVHVFAVTLEKPSVEMEVRQIEPGNIFHNDEKPELAVALRARRDGEYCLRWTIRNDAGRIMVEKPHAMFLRADAGETIVSVDLVQPELGWYEIVFELDQAERNLLRHTASFALLGADTRQAGVADSPYGTWWFTHHYCPKDPDIAAGPLLLKAGLRRAHNATPDEATLAPWKVTAGTIGWPGALLARNAPDHEIETFIDQRREKFPSCNNIMVFWENAEWGYRVAPELSGMTPLPEHEFSNSDTLFEWAMRLGKLVREKYPDLEIIIGNSLGCSELIAAMLRRGFPAAYADYLGNETVGRTGQPEKVWAGGLQTAWLMREVARIYGHHTWGVTSCVECNYRHDRILGQQQQAEWYVRDALLLHAYRAPHISVGVLFDTGNNYNASFWGGTGLCRRYPFLYPKKSYVALATLTRVLDRAEFIRERQTGSRSVYALEFKRPDGNIVTALWAGRGTAELTLTFRRRNCRYELVDLFGRGRTGASGWYSRRLHLTARTAVQYVITAEPARELACGPRSYPENTLPDNLRVLAPMDDAADWQLVPGVDSFLEETTRTELPYRTAGTFTLRQVEDEEKGPCLELELHGRTELPALMSEYTVLRLRQPIAVAGEPSTLGLWVKGNSGWGEVYWEIEDANGVRRLSCGTTEHGTSVFDYDGGLATINFDDWNFLRMPITEKSSVPDLSTGSVANLWQVSDRSRAVAYPITITGLAVSLPPRAMVLTEIEPIRQVIRLKDLSVYQ